MATPLAGRAALARGAWAEARASFEAALAEEETAEALEGLSWATWWLDDVDACFDARERAYRRYREDGDLRGAARMALWLSDDHSEFRRKEAVAGGWFQRAARLLAELPPAPEHGWLAVFEAHATLAAGDPEGALRLAGEARELGRELGAVDVEMFALATEGVVLVAQGAVADGHAPARRGRRRGARRRVRRPARGGLDVLPADRRLRARARLRPRGAVVRGGRGVQPPARRPLRQGRLPRPLRRGAVLARRLGGRRARADRRAGGADREAAGVALGRRRPAGRAAAAPGPDRRGARAVRRRGARPAGAARPRRGGARRAATPPPPARSAERLLRAATAPTARAGALELLVRACGRRRRRRGAPPRRRAARDRRRARHARRCAPPRATARASSPPAAGDHEAALARHDAALEGYAGSEAPLETARARLGARRGARRARAERGRAARGGRRRRGAATRSAPSRSAGARARSRGGSARRRAASSARARSRSCGSSPTASATARSRAELTLSEHTVHRHVANIHAKLRCSSRAAAVALAHRRGLL